MFINCLTCGKNFGVTLLQFERLIQCTCGWCVDLAGGYTETVHGKTPHGGLSAVPGQRGADSGDSHGAGKQLPDGCLLVKIPKL